jgi:hypothetical protein
MLVQDTKNFPSDPTGARWGELFLFAASPLLHLPPEIE